MKHSFAIFIPCYEVANSVESVILRIPSEIWQNAKKVYCIDNQSSDHTIDILLGIPKIRSHPGYEVYRNSKNVTLGGSTILAFDLAIQDKLDYVICLHSDGQADPEDLEKFLLSMNHSSPDFVAGRRGNYDRVRHLGNQFFHLLQKKIFSLPENWDLGAFLAFKMETIQKIPYQKIPANMGYHPHLILFAHLQLKNIQVGDVTISWGKVEKSSINPFVYGFLHLIRLFRIYFQQNLSPKNQKISSEKLFPR